MNIAMRQLNPHSCLTYLVTIEEKHDAVLIDPVLDHVQDYTSLLEREGLTLVTVIDTHTHADHISGAAALKDMTGCEYLMHPNAPAECADGVLDDGREIRLLGGIPVKVIYSPGHTSDSVSLVFTDRIFTGDALFLDDGGAGRDDLPGGDPGLHWETLNKLRNLSDDLVVYPAHDYHNRKPSTLGQQKTTNPHMKDMPRDEFVRYLEDLKLGPADWMKDVLKANYACAMDPKAAWIPVDTPACEVKGTLDKNINELNVIAVDPAGLRSRMESGQPPVLLDVREAHELTGELGHIDGVLHIPIWMLPHRLNELDQYRDRDIVTVCRSGSRAHTAAQILESAGFDRVTVLKGGMIAWRQNEY